MSFRLFIIKGYGFTRTNKNNKSLGVELPLFSSRVSAGFPSPADDHLEDSLDLQRYLVRDPVSHFLVRVSGDSMLGEHIQEGDLLVVDRSLQAKRAMSW